jgi:serine/threonine-protein kinase SRPK3
MTDLKLSNIMLRVEDQSIFADYEKAEDRSPSDRKRINGERTIYASRAFRRPRANAYGIPILCDFGEARIGALQPYTETQPQIYKAPEILMQFEWGHSADIWNAACLVRHTPFLHLLFADH